VFYAKAFDLFTRAYMCCHLVMKRLYCKLEGHFLLTLQKLNCGIIYFDLLFFVHNIFVDFIVNNHVLYFYIIIQL